MLVRVAAGDEMLEAEARASVPVADDPALPRGAAALHPRGPDGTRSQRAPERLGDVGGCSGVVHRDCDCGPHCAFTCAPAQLSSPSTAARDRRAATARSTILPGRRRTSPSARSTAAVDVAGSKRRSSRPVSTCGPEFLVLVAIAAAAAFALFVLFANVLVAYPGRRVGRVRSPQRSSRCLRSGAAGSSRDQLEQTLPLMASSFRRGFRSHAGARQRCAGVRFADVRRVSPPHRRSPPGPRPRGGARMGWPIASATRISVGRAGDRDPSTGRWGPRRGPRQSASNHPRPQPAPATDPSAQRGRQALSSHSVRAADRDACLDRAHQP